MHMIIWEVYELTVARSFWVKPFSCLPSWMTLPTSKGTLSWCSSSVSLSSLAVFFVTRCCLFCPADPVWQAGDCHHKTYKYSMTTQDITLIWRLPCFAYCTNAKHHTKASLQVNCCVSGFVCFFTNFVQKAEIYISWLSRVAPHVSEQRWEPTENMDSNFQNISPLSTADCNFAIILQFL